jgi:hypothetical protein
MMRPTTAQLHKFRAVCGQESCGWWDRTPQARRVFAERLLFRIATGAAEFITGPCWKIRGGWASRSARSCPGSTAPACAATGVLYEIDEAKHVLIVLGIRHRSAAYRRR